MSYRIVNGRAYPVGNIGGVQVNKPINNSKSSGSTFKDVLNKTIENNGYTVSKHAADRLEKINFSEVDMKAIEKGFDLAADKGSRNAVMLFKDFALVASIENRTVITAVEKERAVDNVFTNIDSVVML